LGKDTLFFLESSAIGAEIPSMNARRHRWQGMRAIWANALSPKPFEAVEP